MATLNTRIILRNDTTTNWTSSEVILKKGEIGIDTDLRRFKVGDGVSR